MISRAKRVFSEEGAIQVVRKGLPFIYEEFVRPRIPKRERTVQFNGINARTGDVCPIDHFIPWFETPWYNDDDPMYEQPLLETIKSTVEPGDTVIIVGGGWGVTATIAASIVGSNGEVIVYEGAAQRIADIEGTLRINNLRNRVTVQHAIVGEPVALTGVPGNAERIAPRNLPECDVLEMDCEGSETNILPGLNIRPQTLIVETHRNEEIVRDQLDQLGYEVIGRSAEIPKEVFILTTQQY
jgi:hypothetical protein